MAEPFDDQIPLEDAVRRIAEAVGFTSYEIDKDGVTYRSPDGIVHTPYLTMKQPEFVNQHYIDFEIEQLRRAMKH